MVTSINELRRLFLESKTGLSIPEDMDIETAENKWLSDTYGGTITDPKPDLLRRLFDTQSALRWDDFLRAEGYTGAREQMLRQYYIDNT